MIAAQGIVVTTGRRRLVDVVSIAVRPGQVTAVLGPNGSGKSTLLKVLAGEIAPSGGSVSLDGRPLAAWRRADLARRRAVLPQHGAIDFPLTAGEVVALGRSPWSGRPESLDDADAVAHARERLDLGPLWDQLYPTLSGGERQRVQLGRALAQLWVRRPAAPRYLLLDEPTSALDIAHQLEVLALARELAGKGIGVLAVLHDLNQALTAADGFVLLARGQIVEAGAIADGPTAAALQAVYHVPVEFVRRADGRRAALV
ncbi:MAG: heme ABC transporter ATP-binding protein [Alphaproteobacteria bacterium]|nr:heme ABC transporter ATP-binding protein [Alphaproteobacteria bacterium]